MATKMNIVALIQKKFAGSGTSPGIKAQLLCDTARRDLAGLKSRANYYAEQIFMLDCVPSEQATAAVVKKAFEEQLSAWKQFSVIKLSSLASKLGLAESDRPEFEDLYSRDLLEVKLVRQ
jgi:hypothetical protein